MRETQQTISAWALDTFGPGATALSVSARALKEMAELIMTLTIGDEEKARDEVADVAIVLCQVAEKLGVRIDQAINEKMIINRARKWALDGKGQGQHVNEVEEDLHTRLGSLYGEGIKAMSQALEHSKNSR